MAESGAREPATHAIGVRVTAAQFAWLSQQPGTSGSVIRRLLDREVARGAAPGNGKVSRAELLGVAAQITELAERVESRSSAPVVGARVDTPEPPPPDPQPVAVESSPRPEPESVGEEPAGRIGPQPAMPEPEASAPMAVESPPEPAVEAVTSAPPPSEMESWLETWLKVPAASALLTALDVKLNRTDADLTSLVRRQGKSRVDFDQYLYRLMTRWSRKRAAPVPADQAEATAAFAADLRAALAKRAEAVAPVRPEPLSPPSPAT
ncbi:MAG: hypothetical protein ACYCZN_12130 [Candidatus Dormibacteria bacterium]